MFAITPHIYLAFSGAALFCAVLFLLNRQPNTATKSFAVLFFVFALDTGLKAFILLKGYREYPHLLGLSRPLILLYGPLFYIAFSYMTANITKIKAEHFFHFLPFIAYTFFLTPFFLKTGATKIFLYEHYVKGVAYIDFFPHLMMFIKVFLFIIYAVMPLMFVIKFKRTVVAFYSTVDTVKLVRQQIIAVSYFLCSFILVYYLFVYFTGPDFIRPDIPGTFFYPLAAVFFMTAFFSLSDPLFLKCTISTADLKFDKETGEDIENNEENSDPKYKKNKIPDDLAQRSLTDLKELMAEKKPFTDSSLTHIDLAGMLHIKPYHLSQLINSRLGENFYVFINTARVKYAADLMKDAANSNKSILEIAYLSGFNSKSAFNTYFKEIFNETPGKFRKKHL